MRRASARCIATGGELRFRALPCLTNDDVAEVLQVARTRILALLRRRGVLADDDQSGASVVTTDEALAESEPALAELAAASVTGRVPAGPALRRREPVKLRAGSEPSLTKALCATEQGFSLHAATTASASDATGREALCKYILRPPLAQDRVQLVEGDLVRLVLKRPFSDGTFALELDPLSFLARLATSVHPPRFNTVRYAGVLGSASTWRSRIVPPAPPVDENQNDHDRALSSAKKGCGGRMKLRALVITSTGIERYLTWLGEPTEPPTLAPARGPPFFKSVVIRRKLGEPVQTELFDAH